MRVHFLMHVTTGGEVDRVPAIREQLATHFPGSLLHVINQTLTPVADSVVMENTKAFGFGWTLRFLDYAKWFLEPDDLLIKIDPDIMLTGNPLSGVGLGDPGSCFGQVKKIAGHRVFLGCFQGYTTKAVKAFLKHGLQYTNETGAQDIIAWRTLESLGLPFTPLPHLDLWAEPDNYDLHSKVLSFRRK